MYHLGLPAWRAGRVVTLVVLAVIAACLLATAPSSATAPLVAQTHGDSVWVNTRSGVYHCPGSHSYGTSKHGQYMAEATAVSRGFRPAKGRSCAAREATRHPAGTAHEGQVWVNTRSHVYHCPGTSGYGRSHEGAYMTEQAALAAGNHPAKGRRCQ
jgi:hypothetical protein